MQNLSRTTGEQYSLPSRHLRFLVIYIYLNRTGSPENIKRMEKDLEKGTQYVDIIPMLESFVSLIVLESEGNEAQTDIASLRRVGGEGKQIFNDMFEDAISFCNDVENSNRREMIQHLEE